MKKWLKICESIHEACKSGDAGSSSHIVQRGYSTSYNGSTSHGCRLFAEEMNRRSIMRYSLYRYYLLAPSSRPRHYPSSLDYLVTPTFSPLSSLVSSDFRLESTEIDFSSVNIGCDYWNHLLMYLFSSLSLNS